MGTEQSPQPAWTRGVLPLCLLSVLDSEDRSYGYALLSRLSDAGFENVKAAALYPALTRLEEEGAVEVEWGAGEGGPGRKYYRITDRGRARLRGEGAAWRAFAATVESVLEDRVPRKQREQGEEA
ncbi:PadR family transcriptional regulator [Streptomyces sp. PR69]|uniref:PadR family transcriptional regulator n=1 Tax=Streptomyces sp. PR69 TaxID=2984950 RepID=UPI002265511F|nr:PadR family transcriptional regulator [Streptomyces sp. PR69]